MERITRIKKIAQYLGSQRFLPLLKVRKSIREMLALHLLIDSAEGSNHMVYTVKKLMHNTFSAIELGYKIIRGIDYQTLSQYILKINRHKDINDILFEVSSCLKDILDYELFGFALKNGNTIDVWIDPRMYSAQLTDYIAQDFNSQNIGFNVHCFEKNNAENCRISDTVEIDINKLISYKVIENNYVARLYILPKKKMLYHHDNIISTIVSSIGIALEKNLSIKQLENAVAIDPLTNCYNRRALDSFIESDISYARRSGTDLSIIMLDLDNFKDINDVHGHLAGDAVLKEISTLIPALVRKSDYLARYGGEEFMLVLPDTSLYLAVQLAEKLRKKIEEHEIDLGEKRITVTASIGVASLDNKRDSMSLVQEADERMYKAKSTGKNNVIPSMLPCFADRRFVSKEVMNTCTDAAHVA